MIYLLDLLLVLILSGVVIFNDPVLGVFVLLLVLFFGAQYWKTWLLMGSSTEDSKTSKKIKAAILSIIFTSFLGVVLQADLMVESGKMFSDVWNDDLFPVLIGICLICSLLMATLATERRKR